MKDSHELNEFNPIEDDEGRLLEELPTSPTEVEDDEGRLFEEKATTPPQAYTEEEQQREHPETVRTEPVSIPGMVAEPRLSENSGRSSITVSEVGSGYVNDTNDCTDFCMDFLVCFGLLDTCCPSDGEGYVTTAAAFCGNILFSCCKYKGK